MPGDSLARQGLDRCSGFDIPDLLAGYEMVGYEEGSYWYLVWVRRRWVCWWRLVVAMSWGI